MTNFSKQYKRDLIADHKAPRERMEVWSEVRTAMDGILLPFVPLSQFEIDDIAKAQAANALLTHGKGATLLYLRNMQYAIERAIKELEK